jgi:predicted nucleotide-binding protein
VLRDAGPPVAGDSGVTSPDGGEESPPDTADRSAGQAMAETPPAAPDEMPPAGSLNVPVSNRQFFVAHGRDKTALSQLQSILKDLDIPYVVAEEEPNVGRPISEKIADLMRSCSAGIFIFSGDEEVTDPNGLTVKRPRPNVVYELGAASFQYGQRIVIFKERGVEFPTDFRDLGYIEYDKGLLSAKSMELLRELIMLKAVKVTAGP